LNTFVCHFVALLAFQEMKVKGSSRAAHTHNIHLKLYNKFTEDVNKISLKTGNTSQQKILLNSGENSWWPHEKLQVAACGHGSEREKRWLST
jgi:hypothetical protein